MSKLVNQIESIIKILIYGIVLFVPILLAVSFTLNPGTDHAFNISLKISFSDVLLMVTAGLFLIRVILSGDLRSVKLPKRNINLFILAVFISVIYATSTKGFVIDFIQLLLSFYILYIVLLNTKLSGATTRKLIYLLGGSSVFVILHAAYQYYYLDTHPYFVRSLFPNRNILGVYLAATGPLLFAVLLSSKNNVIRLACFLALEVAFFAILSFGHLIALTAAVLIIAFLNERRSFYYTVGVVAMNIILFFTLAPEQSKLEFFKSASIYEKGDVEKNILRSRFYNDIIIQGAFIKENIGNLEVGMANDFFIPNDVVNSENFDFGEYAPIKNDTVLKQYYVESQAALNMISELPFTGFGLGNYQDRIGSFYQRLEKNNTSEPDYNNGYLIITATTGIIGLWLFISILLTNGQKLLNYRRNNKNSANYGMVLGLLGSLIAISMSVFFTYIFISQLTILFTIIIFLGQHIITPEHEQK